MIVQQRKATAVDIITAVDKKIEKVRTKSMDISFNELLDMYEGEELIIDPEYQRLFRWSPGKQSRFIESLILELPVPPIFVIEGTDNTYELIDGLQRISSYLHFVGKLPIADPQNLILEDCDIVKELNGLAYQDLPKSIEIKLKRSFVRVEILRKESDSRLRYYMFKRLNTGGEPLSNQEIRNCTTRLLDEKFNSFIIRVSQYEDFRNCINLISPEKRDQKYDQELVLRFFAFKNHREKYVHEVGDFMTEYMEQVSDPGGDDDSSPGGDDDSSESSNSKIVFDYESEELIFKKTFKILNRVLDEKIFAPANDKGTLVSRFSPYHYEAFSLGIQPYLDQLDVNNEMQMSKVRDKFQEVKSDERFRSITTGGGKNYAKPLNDRINFITEAVASLL